MTRMMQRMTAALVLPQAMAAETMARTAALWARRMAEALRPRGSAPMALTVVRSDPKRLPVPTALPAPQPEKKRLTAPAPTALPAPRPKAGQIAAPPTTSLPAPNPETAQLAAPAPEAPGGGTGQDNMEAARAVLAGADPDPVPDAPATIAAGPDRAEETGGPVQDTATLVDVATGTGGGRPAPDGAIA